MSSTTLQKPLFSKKLSGFWYYIKLLLCFLILHCFYVGYEGLIKPTGAIYSPFLAKYLNFFNWHTVLLTQSAKVILLPFYASVTTTFNSLQIEHSRGIRMEFPCLGIEVMNFWIALIFANTGSVKFKCKWMLIGLSAITFLNVLRVALVAMANHHHWDFITSLDPHQSFNIATYICIFILFFIYIKYHKRFELHRDVPRKPLQNQLRTA